MDREPLARVARTAPDRALAGDHGDCHGELLQALDLPEPRLPGDAKSGGGARDAQAQRLNALAENNAAGLGEFFIGMDPF
jgi:hypothetical protein